MADVAYTLGMTPDAMDGHNMRIAAERFSGLLVGKLSDSILRKTQHGFVAMNEALKERAESH